MFLQLILIYFPALVFGLLFAKNYRKEPRQFRNALYFLLLCLFAFSGRHLLVGALPSRYIEEGRSATTWENLRNSKAIMDARSGVGAYRAAVVTSDYHVFRTAEYAHKIGLVADGVGSKTARYFWPTAFIREFVAVSNEHRGPFIVLFILCLIPTVLALTRT